MGDLDNVEANEDDFGDIMDSTDFDADDQM